VSVALPAAEFLSPKACPVHSTNFPISCRYFTDIVQIDPDSVWLDLCRGTEQAKNYCRVFLRSYVVDSERAFVTLGPEEYEFRRTVNSASSITQCWRELIAKADSTVLWDKRREDPEKFDLWRLRFLDHTNQRG
jgi:hypothetical protein